MAADSGTIELTFRAKLDQLDRDMDSARSKATKAAGDIGDDIDTKVSSKLGKVQSAATGVGQAFAGLQMSRVFTDQIMSAGDTARRFQDQVSGAASATGLSMDMLTAKAKSFEFIPPTVAAEGIKNLSLLNQSMGITGDASIDLSMKTLEVAQAMSVVAGVPVEEVLNGVTGAARGEYDQIQKLVPSLNSAAVEQAALAATGKTTASSLTEAEKSQAALNLILAEGNRFLPQLAANSDNAAAAQRRKAAAAEEAKIAMGDKLLPIMEKVSDVTSKLFEWFSKLPGPVQTFVLGAIILATVLAPMALAISGVATATAALGISMSAVLLPILAVIAVIALIVAAVYLIIKHWDTLKEATGAAWDWVVEKISGAWEWIKGAVSAAVEWVSSSISAAWDWVKDKTGQAWEGLKNAVSSGIDSVISFLTGLPGRAVDALSSLGGLIADLATTAMRWMWERVSSGAENVVELARGLPGRVLDGLGNIASFLYDAGRNLLEGMINGLKSMAGRLIDAALAPVRAAVSAVKNFLGIGSPSKLAMGMMVDFGRGEVRGLERSADMVARAALAHAGVTVDSVAGGLGSGSGGSGGGLIDYDQLAAAIGRGSKGGMQMTFNTQVAPLHVAREIAWAQGS